MEEEEEGTSPSLTQGRGRSGRRRLWKILADIIIGEDKEGERKGRGFWKVLGKCVRPSVVEGHILNPPTAYFSAPSFPSKCSAEQNWKSGAISSSRSSNLKESQRLTLVSSKVRSFPFIPKKVEDLRNIETYGNVVFFTFQEIEKATHSFRPDLILGEGGFGVVYKGTIDENIRRGFDNTAVAVKVLNPNGCQGDREWLAEVSHLGQFSHPNLVKLIGCCCEGEHRMLIYEFMAGGCVERHLFRRICLTMPWSVRIQIALGAAKGLAFLHGNERPIIYRDFKTENILLDQDFNAKLSDFGLAKEGPSGDQTHVSTRVMGTYGYAAPEYVMTGHLTARSDVYGYGVVLLEMLIGRRAIDRRKVTREHNLVDWARPLLTRSRKLIRIMDLRMEGQYTFRAMKKVATLTYQCLSLNPKERPTMSQVVQYLEAIQDLCKQKPIQINGREDAVALIATSNDSLDGSYSCSVDDGFQNPAAEKSSEKIL